MSHAARQAAIDSAEAAIGSRLPPGLRLLLEETGEAFFRYPKGVGAEPVFRLCAHLDGAALFAGPTGGGLIEIGGWDSDATGWHLTERAFVALDNESGDYVLLAPDADGIARRVIFCDHETYALDEIAADIDSILVRA